MTISVKGGSAAKEVRKKWVLIVEDDLDISAMISEELDALGIKVLQCANTVDAFRMLGNQKFDCVLLDMRLEHGAGDQVVSYIRRDTQGFNYSTPILVISGQLNPELVQKIKADVTAFFVKPFDMKSLVTRIQTLCG